MLLANENSSNQGDKLIQYSIMAADEGKTRDSFVTHSATTRPRRGARGRMYLYRSTACGRASTNYVVHRSALKRWRA
jgi:hypothetical protein